MVARPVLDYGLPLVLAGELRLNVGNVLGLHGLTAVIPLLLLLTAILWAVPWAERLWMRRRVTGGNDVIQNPPADTWNG
jgi:hypothetical protein